MTGFKPAQKYQSGFFSKTKNMKKIIYPLGVFLTISIIIFSCAQVKTETICLTDFGAIPDDGKNDIEALRAASEYCQEHKGTVLKIPEGVYDVIDPEALQIEFDAISGKYGDAGGVQDALWKPGAPYVTVLDFSGSENVSVEAQGATLCMHGWYEPVSIINCNNFLLSGLSITYKRPPTTEGKIIVKKDNYFDVRIDTTIYKFLKDTVYGATQAYDIVKNRVINNLQTKTHRLVDPQTIRVSFARADVNVGDVYMIRHSYHYRPGIMIKKS